MISQWTLNGFELLKFVFVVHRIDIGIINTKMRLDSTMCLKPFQAKNMVKIIVAFHSFGALLLYTATVLELLSEHAKAIDIVSHYTLLCKHTYFVRPYCFICMCSCTAQFYPSSNADCYCKLSTFAKCGMGRLRHRICVCMLHKIFIKTKSRRNMYVRK